MKNLMTAGLMALTSMISFTPVHAIGPDHGDDIDYEFLHETFKSKGEQFKLELVSKGYKVPWSMAFISDDLALLGERSKGKLTLLNVRTGDKKNVEGLPQMLRSGKLSAGIFDIKPDPDFNENKWVYIVHAIGTEKASGLAVTRMTLNGNTLTEPLEMYRQSILYAGKWHFGGRLVIKNNLLFLSVGDGYEYRDQAQDPNHPAGKIISINKSCFGADPSHPVGGCDNASRVIAIGVRNPQGMTLHPKTKNIWFHEHGPQGGDEINILKDGTNYGWPIITYGEEYGGGKIGEGTHKAGMEQPVLQWTPSIAPSGMTFYSGKVFKKWKGDLFVGALAMQHLNHLTVKDTSVKEENRLFKDAGWRIRFIVEGPKGYLYFGNDDGMIVRMVPNRHSQKDCH